MVHQIITLPPNATCFFYNDVEISLSSGYSSCGYIEEHVFPSGEHKIEPKRIAEFIKYFTVNQTNLPNIPILRFG